MDANLGRVSPESKRRMACLMPLILAEIVGCSRSLMMSSCVRVRSQVKYSHRGRKDKGLNMKIGEGTRTRQEQVLADAFVFPFGVSEPWLSAGTPESPEYGVYHHAHCCRPPLLQKFLHHKG